MGKLTVVRCSVSVFEGSGLIVELSAIPDGVEVLIEDERFVGPALIGPALLHELSSRSGTVRIGPCPVCGVLAERLGGGVLEPHSGEDVVYCIMRS